MPRGPQPGPSPFSANSFPSKKEGLGESFKVTLPAKPLQAPLLSFHTQIWPWNGFPGAPDLGGHELAVPSPPSHLEETRCRGTGCALPSCVLQGAPPESCSWPGSGWRSCLSRTVLMATAGRRLLRLHPREEPQVPARLVSLRPILRSVGLVPESQGKWRQVSI